MKMPDHEWLTRAEVADHFQVTPRTISRWAASNPAMRVARIGRIIRIHRSVLDAGQPGPTPAHTEAA
mgnify:CR=1 FL=1